MVELSVYIFCTYISVISLKSCYICKFYVYFSVPPLELQLQTNIPQPFIAGQNIQISCQSFGSYPKSHIHWRKNRTMLVGEERITNNGNVTKSFIEFIAQPSDDANEIECAAVNPDIDTYILRRVFFMRVYCKYIYF